MLVPVNVDKSSIHGMGIFAAPPITGDTRIWQFTPGFDLDLDPRALVGSEIDVCRKSGLVGCAGTV